MRSGVRLGFINDVVASVVCRNPGTSKVGLQQHLEASAALDCLGNNHEISDA